MISRRNSCFSRAFGTFQRRLCPPGARSLSEFRAHPRPFPAHDGSLGRAGPGPDREKFQGGKGPGGIGRKGIFSQDFPFASQIWEILGDPGRRRLSQGTSEQDEEHGATTRNIRPGDVPAPSKQNLLPGAFPAQKAGEGNIPAGRGEDEGRREKQETSSGILMEIPGYQREIKTQQIPNPPAFAWNSARRRSLGRSHGRSCSLRIPEASELSIPDMAPWPCWQREARSWN